MMRTLNKHVRWREDNKAIFICDCKRLIDLKISLKYKDFMKRLDEGLSKNKLNKEEEKVFSDFEKMNLLSKIKVQTLKKEDFEWAMKILDNEISKERVRQNLFLYKKFKQFPNFFIGIFLDKKIGGIICGFPREDYLLMSEIAVDSKFRKRGFGRRLVKAFEEVAKEKYSQIKVGAEDKATGFYSSLEYKPFLLVQFEKDAYSLSDFKNFKIIKSSQGRIEMEIKNCEINTIEKLRKEYPKANFQYIFKKSIIQ